MALNRGSISPTICKTTGLVETKNGIWRQYIKLLSNKITLAGWTKILSQALRHLNDQSVGPVALYACLGIPAKAPSTVKLWKWRGKKTLPRLSPWINLLCCWEHQAPSLLGIISWNLQWDISPRSETLHPWVKGNYSISSGIPLSCCKLDLLKHMVPEMEHTVLKEGRKWGSWSSISHPQSTSSCLRVLPTQSVCMVCTSRPAS